MLHWNINMQCIFRKIPKELVITASRTQVPFIVWLLFCLN